MTIDVEGLKKRYSIEEVAARYVDLKPNGREFKGLCPVHSDKNPSFYVVPDKGFAWCFACGFKAGDIIEFVQKVEDVDFQAACHILGADDLPDRRSARPLIAAPDKTADWTPIVPVPAGAPGMDPQTVWNPRRGKTWTMRPTMADAYRDADGNLHGYVLRVEYDRGGETVKLTPQVTFCRSIDGEERWCAVGMPSPRPMLGAELLSGRPEAKVLIVEGEKARRAAEALLGGFVCLSWVGGANGVRKTDFGPLTGRNVLLMPDADAKPYPKGHPKEGQVMPWDEQPGEKAVQAIAALAHAAGAEVVRYLDTSDQAEISDGWDIADWTGTAAEFGVWAKPRISEIRGEIVEAAMPEQARDTTAGPAPSADEQLAYEEKLIRSAPAEDDESISEPDEPVDILRAAKPAHLNREFIPPVLADYVWDQAELIGVDPCVIAMGCIIGCAAMINDKIKLQVKRSDSGWVEEARLWGAVVGEPSMKKTPSLRAALRPINRLSDDLVRSSGIAMLKYADEMADWKAGAADRRKQRKLAPIPLSEQQAPERPLRKRIIVEDTTIEALADTLKDNPRGVLASHDELAKWFGNMDAYKSNDSGERASWLQMYQGGPREIQRVGREVGTIPNWSASIIGGIQPGSLRRLGSGKGTVDDGLMQRFMFVIADPDFDTDDEIDRAPNADFYRAYEDVVTGLYDAQAPQFPIRMSDGASQVRDQVRKFVRTMIKIESLPDQMRTAVAKYEGLFPRLTLTFHCIEQVAAGQPIHKDVSRTTAQRAARFLGRFLIQHTYAIYTDILCADDKFAHAKWIAGYILSHNTDILTARNITRAYSKFSALRQFERDQATNALVEFGWITAMGTPRPGKPTIRWRVNPLVHVRFADHAEQEKARRANTMKRRQEGARYVPGLGTGEEIDERDE